MYIWLFYHYSSSSNSCKENDVEEEQCINWFKEGQSNAGTTNAAHRVHTHRVHTLHTVHIQYTHSTHTVHTQYTHSTHSAYTVHTLHTHRRPTFFFWMTPPLKYTFMKLKRWFLGGETYTYRGSTLLTPFLRVYTSSRYLGRFGNSDIFCWFGLSACLGGGARPVQLR